MAERSLRAELAEVVGSAKEATWILEQITDPTIARQVARRRAAGEPLQYLLGTWPFRGIDLLVDDRALIPRPETEQVVDHALAAWRRSRPGSDGLVIADLGTGSGAIGLSLGAELSAEATIFRIMLGDLSERALELAGANAARLGIEVELHCGSWHEAIPAEMRRGVHLLVANPPYVAAAAEAHLAVELSFEPRMALISADADDGTPGFAEVAAVIDGAVGSLAPDGIVVVEMAEHQVAVAIGRAEAAGLVDVHDIVDLAGHPRGIVGRAP